jgi:hypothetical protein
MGRLSEFDLDPANANLTGFASNVTGAAFTLTANVSGDDLAHQVSIRNDTANDHSGKTVTLVGTDADGRAQTEVVTGPSGSATVESSKYFLTLTSATPSATIGADTFDIGWVDEVATKTYPLNRFADKGALVQFDVTGTINLTAQITLKAIANNMPTDQNSIPWVSSATTALVGATADAVGSLEAGATACRFIINSYTDTAEVQVYLSEESD